MKVDICPICQSKKNYSVLIGQNIHGTNRLSGRERFTYFKCASCGAIFLKNAEADRAFYKKYYAGINPKKKRVVFNILQGYYSKFIHRLKENVILSQTNTSKGKIAILDVGSGDGGFLLDLDKELFDKEGIELESTPDKGSGLNMISGNFLEYSFGKKKFDIITFWHSLEHMPTPLAAVAKAKKLLNENGIIIISVPNGDSWGFLLAKDKWFHFDAPRHLVLFNPKSLSAICSHAGLKIIRKMNLFYEFPLDLFWSSRKSFLFPLILIFYPIIKIFDKETLTYVYGKN